MCEDKHRILETKDRRKHKARSHQHQETPRGRLECSADLGARPKGVTHEMPREGDGRAASCFRLRASLVNVHETKGVSENNCINFWAGDCSSSRHETCLS